MSNSTQNETEKSQKLKDLEELIATPEFQKNNKAFESVEEHRLKYGHLPSVGCCDENVTNNTQNDWHDHAVKNPGFKSGLNALKDDTQNDWETLFFRIFDQDRFPTLKGDYNDFIKFKEDTIKIIEDFIRKEQADARKEVIEKVEKMKMDDLPDVILIDDGTEYIEVEGYTYNAVLDRVLATLREEKTK